MRHEEQLLKQARQIEYLQNIITRMPVVALASKNLALANLHNKITPQSLEVQSTSMQTVDNIEKVGACDTKNVQTEDGWVAC